jgi:hypothetical protein
MEIGFASQSVSVIPAGRFGYLVQSLPQMPAGIKYLSRAVRAQSPLSAVQARERVPPGSCPHCKLS